MNLKLFKVTDGSLTVNGKNVKQQLLAIIPKIIKYGYKTKNNITSLTYNSFKKIPKSVKKNVLKVGLEIDYLLKRLRVSKYNYIYLIHYVTWIT